MGVFGGCGRRVGVPVLPAPARCVATYTGSDLHDGKRQLPSKARHQDHDPSTNEDTLYSLDHLNYTSYPRGIPTTFNPLRAIHPLDSPPSKPSLIPRSTLGGEEKRVMTPNEPDARPPDLPTALSDKNDEPSSLRHLASLHALHGPPGVPSPHAARATSWLASLFVSPRTIPFRVPIPERHLEVLGRGFVPGFPGCPWQDGEVEVDGLWEPEHKWFIFSESEGGEEQDGERGRPGGVWRVHMYRSWTGVKLVELRIETGPPRPALEASYSQDGVSAPDDGTKNEIEAGAREDEQAKERGEDGPRVTHITFETHLDYKLKGADAALYKSVAREVCWWVMRVCLGPETAD